MKMPCDFLEKVMNLWCCFLEKVIMLGRIVTESGECHYIIAGIYNLFFSFLTVYCFVMSKLQKAV